MGEQPKVVPFPDGGEPIAKPDKFDLNRFRSKHDATIANVETLQTVLPHHNIAQANDFVRLHPNEETHWSFELCFVNVPIKGQKRDLLHLIDEEIALRYLPSGKIKRFRLALATKPFDVFFLCHVPSQNVDNDWNKTNLTACERAKTTWVQVSSRKAENVDGYKIDYARDPDAFPEPRWASQLLIPLIETTFVGRWIGTDEHPALLRLIGAKQKLG